MHMEAGNQYYHFTEDEYLTLDSVFHEEIEGLLVCDDTYGIWYAPAISPFGSWVDGNLDRILDEGWEGDITPEVFAPLSGGIAGWRSE